MEATDQQKEKDIFGWIDEPGDFVSGIADGYYQYLGNL